MARLDQDREPVSTYDGALWRLVAYAERLGEEKQQQLLPAVRIVADIFWVTEAKVWTDVRKRQGEL